MYKEEMLNEIKRLRDEMKNLDFATRNAIINRQNELLEHSHVNVTKGGNVRYYLTKNASREVVEDYLVQLINAIYDVCGFCF